MAAPNLLVINPNTSQAVTARLVDAVHGETGPGCEVRGVKARFGARYISCEASYAVAGHAVLDAWAAHCAQHREPDAVLSGCFGDPGLWALRERSRQPVVGLAEASMREAIKLGRFAIVTGGAAWGPMLRRLALALGLDSGLAGVHLLASSGAALAADPVGAITLLRAACAEAAVPDVRSVILGGAGLAGMAPDVADGLALPLIDSGTAGARALVAAARTERPTPSLAPVAQPWQGLSPALTQALD